MRSNDAILIALLVVLVIIVACQIAGRARDRGGCDGFTGASPHRQYDPGDGPYNPYTVLNKQLDAVRGIRNDGYNQPSLLNHPRGLDRYHRAGANLTPEMVAEAEREQWFAANGGREGFNPEPSDDPGADMMQYHAAAPDIDYNTYVTDLIADPRLRENQRRWVEEMKPWAGTAMTVDNLDLEPYVDFTGLRRPQAVVQFNPLQLTEVDASDLSVNAPFRFKG
jgi:hypothetical protein